MLTPIFNAGLSVVAQLALSLFNKQAFQLGENVRLRLITHSEAVEMLEVKPTYGQFIRDYGPELVQQIMADGLNLRGTA